VTDYKLSTSDVAKSLGKCPKTIIRLVRQGHLTGFRVGRTFRFSEADVADYLKRSKVVPTSGYSESFVSAVADFEHQKAERYCEDEKT
jgi:excisionase family DNA binding protein